MWIPVGAGCLLVIVAGWWVSGPMRPPWRGRFRLLLAITLVAMVSPPGLIESARTLVARILPGASALGSTESAAVLVHLLLFALVSALLFRHRRDLRALPLFAGLIALAFTTEGMQYLVDGRQAGWADVAVNVAGTTLGALLVLAMGGLRV